MNCAAFVGCKLVLLLVMERVEWVSAGEFSAGKKGKKERRKRKERGRVFVSRD